MEGSSAEGVQVGDVTLIRGDLLDSVGISNSRHPTQVETQMNHSRQDLQDGSSSPSSFPILSSCHPVLFSPADRTHRMIPGLERPFVHLVSAH
jgi:hypothetical protein